MNFMKGPNIDVNTVENSKIYQAGRDIHIENKIPNEVGEGIQEILNILKAEQNSLLTKLLTEKLEAIKNNFNEGKLSEAELCIEKLIKEDSKSVPEEYKVKLYYYKGLILLEKNDVEGTKNCIRIIIDINKELVKAYELQYRISVQTDDNDLFEGSLKALKQLEVTKENIELKRIFFQLKKGNYDDVICSILDKNEIKECYKNNDNALYYLGIALINTNQYENGAEYLRQAYAIKPLKSYKYNSLIAEILPILTKEGIVCFIDNEEKQFMKNKLNELMSFTNYFAESDNKIKSQFWGIILNIKLLIEPESVIIKYEEIPEEVRKTQIIQLMLGEACYLLKEYDRALSIYESLYKYENNCEILIKILDVLRIKEDYESIINRVNGLEYNEYDNRGILISLYLEAMDKVKTFSIISNKIDDLEDKFNDKVLFISTSATIFYRHGMVEKCELFLKKAISLIEKDDDFIRIDIAKICFNINHIQDGIKILLPLEKYSEYARKFLVEKLLSFNKQEYMDIAEKIVDREIANGIKEKYMLNIKADILMKNKKWDKAMEVFQESFHLKRDLYSACNILTIKLNKKDSSDITEYVKYVSESNTENSDVIMLLAFIEKFLGNKGHGEELAFRALYKLNNKFNENVFVNYISFYNQEIIECEEESIVGYDKVRENSVIELINDEKDRKLICINNEKNLVVEDGDISIGCFNYHSASIMGVRLLNKSLHSIIKIKEINYKINSIINKNVYAYRYCMDLYVKNCPNSKALMMITANDAEEMAENIMPILKKQKEKGEFLLNQYNFNNIMGLPISVLCDKDYTKFYDTIITLLNSKNQIFYAGEVTDSSIIEKPIVLSLSTIIMLKIYSKIYILKKYKDMFYIPNTLLEEVKSIFMGVYKTDMKTSGYIGLNENGDITFSELTENQKNDRLEFWRDILETLQEVHIENSIVKDNSKLSNVIKGLVDDFELDCIYLSKQINGIYISDDLFMRKITKSLFEDITTANFISLVEKDNEISYQEYLDIIYRLSEQKYLYIVNENSLYKIINSFVYDKNMEVGYWIRYSKVYKIIENMLSDLQLFNSYWAIIIKTLHKIWDEGLNFKSRSVILVMLMLVEDKKTLLGI